MPESLLDAFIAIHREGTQAFNEGDLDRALAGLPDRVEWQAVSDDPEVTVLRGPEQIREWFDGFRAVFDEWRSEPLEYEQLDDRTVFVHHVIRGTSRGAGVPVEVDTFELWELEGLQPVRIRQFQSRQEALAAVDTG